MDGAEREFQRIYDDNHPRIVRYLRRLVGEAEAEDVAQEVFVKVHQGLAAFRGESSLATWIYRIATNAAADRLRSASSRRLSLHDVADDEDDADTGEPADVGVPRLDVLLIRKDMNDCIRGIVDNLPEQYRTVLVLSDLEGFSNAELCGILGGTLDSVKIRLHRARKRLKTALEKNCTFYRDDRNELACDRKAAPLSFIKE